MPGWYAIKLMWCPRCAVEWNSAEEASNCPECGRQGRPGVDMSTEGSRSTVQNFPSAAPEGETWRL